MNTKTRFYTKAWFCILMLIFIAPIGIYLLWKYKHFPKKVSIILALLSIIFFGYNITNQPADDTVIQKKTVKTTNEASKNTIEPTSDTTATNMPNSSSSLGNEAQIVDTENTDLLLITKSNHPTLFTATNDAHEFWGDKKGIFGWKDRDDKKISYPDTYSNSYGSGVNWDSCILDFKGDMNFANCYDDYIFEININLENFEKPINLNLEKALRLTSDYLPYETLKTYYKFGHSTSYKATKKSQLNNQYYDVLYSPINKDEHNLVLNDTSYDFPDIYITLLENEDKYVSNISINLYQSICTSGRHSIAYGGDYKEVDWNYDFLNK